MPRTERPAECVFGCGRPSRAKGRCAVCYENERRGRQGRRTPTLEVLQLRLHVTLLEAEVARLKAGRA